jgi:hypothetical protein
MNLEISADYTDAGAGRVGIRFMWLDTSGAPHSITLGAYADRDQAGNVADLTMRWARDYFKLHGAISPSDIDATFHRAEAAL